MDKLQEQEYNAQLFCTYMWEWTTFFYTLMGSHASYCNHVVESFLCPVACCDSSQHASSVILLKVWDYIRNVIGISLAGFTIYSD